MIAGHHHYARTVSIQEAFDEFGKEFLGYSILFRQFCFVIGHSKRYTLNQIATYDDGFWGEYPGTFAEIAITVPDKRRDQLII